MNLGKNVYNLLKRQSEVYVKGLGTFKRNHTSAVYDEKRKVYLPPISYIDFDPTGTFGYDFVQYIQQLQEIDRATAEQLVDNAVEELQFRTTQEGQAKLDDLGYLVKYSDSYVFKALDLSGFNYEPVDAPEGLVAPLIEQEEPETKQPPLESLEVEPSVSEIVEPEPIAPIADKYPTENMTSGDIVPQEHLPESLEELDADFDEEDPDEGPRNTVWYVAIAVVVLGIIGVLYYANRGRVTSDEEKLISAVTRDSSEINKNASTQTHKIDTSAQSIPVDTLKKTADSVAKPKSEVPEKVKLIPANHKWQIVIGSHRTLAQAYEQAESYNKAGYSRVRVVPSNLAKNRKKVIWDSYETKKQVDSALLYVQKHIIKDAWPDKIK